MEEDDGTEMVHVSNEQVPSVVEAVHDMDTSRRDVPLTVHVRAPADVTAEMTADQVATMVAPVTAEGNIISEHAEASIADNAELVPSVTTEEGDEQYTE